MILTLTPNPSIDATLALSQPLTSGDVHRAVSVTQVAGGKGVNVTHAVHLAGKESLALFPAHKADPFINLIHDVDIPYAHVDMDGGVRVNTTITEPDGTTTKVNGPGPLLSDATRNHLITSLTHHAPSADWVALAGSLPQGVPAGWYTDLIKEIRNVAPQARIAVDTSDAPMKAIAEQLDSAAPDLIKPNGFELGQLTNQDGLALERAAAAGDYSAVVGAARDVVRRGIKEVLVTLGGSGAVLVTANGAWAATPPPATVKSTVGAGDAALAGYLLGCTQGRGPAESLALSVAYGTAAAAKPGTQFPRPEELDTAHTSISVL
ncbi:1-phosphofructokinase family hexose kinase [Corynebacterium macginleyi]|uniref:1-phosphofructokinase family hexose kinase n=1 Tax=Corynebacterium macginleyi TaxID=38290 RepID=UPI00190D504B|nr:1-phosphofructokinase family hexose kinase [Corynebacterium macginleyi]MBK4161447.1 hexose kinase [Corynebacterium macginleyi]MBK4180774.1 hexose kinase [Corynebacterium macginleyi]MBK4182164.1 hexose kinase [Corynebacterium macginleyi]